MRETDWRTATRMPPKEVEEWMEQITTKDLKAGEYYHILSGDRMVLRIQDVDGDGFEVWEMCPQRVRRYP